MSNWDLPVPYGPAPFPLSEPLYPVSSDWVNWVGQDEDAAKKQYEPGAGVVSSVSIEFQISEFVFPLSGSPPGNWEKEDKTVTTVPPAEHKDFTRFRRKYPNTMLQNFKCVVVIVRVTFYPGPPTIWNNTHTYWNPIGAPYPENDYWVHRWAQTSGVRTIAGFPCIWYDGSVPSTWTGQEPYPSDVGPNEDPPDGLLEPPVIEVHGDLGGSKEAKSEAPQLIRPSEKK